jgi:hypothetical protein
MEKIQFNGNVDVDERQKILKFFESRYEISDTFIDMYTRSLPVVASEDQPEQGKSFNWDVFAENINDFLDKSLLGISNEKNWKVAMQMIFHALDDMIINKKITELTHAVKLVKIGQKEFPFCKYQPEIVRNTQKIGDMFQSQKNYEDEIHIVLADVRLSIYEALETYFKEEDVKYNEEDFIEKDKKKWMLEFFRRK